jgi:hypothetical protein
VSVNWAAGRGDSSAGISSESIETMLSSVVGRLRDVLTNMACMNFQENTGV